MINAKEIHDPAGEIFDEELKKILGDQYHERQLVVDGTADAEEDEQVQAAGGTAFWNRVKAPVMLALADGLMFYMCLGGKIDQIYGMAFLACISMAFGHSLRKPGAYEA